MAGRKAEKRQIRYTTAKEAAEKEASMQGSKAYRLPKGVSEFKFTKKGTVRLDFLPYITGKGNPSSDEGCAYYRRSYFVHTNVGADNDKFCCPKQNFGKPCPICEDASRKRATISKEEFTELILPLLPKHRDIYNVIDRDNPDAGVQILEHTHHFFGKGVFLDEMAEASEGSKDPKDDWSKFWHPSGGHTLKMTVMEDSYNGNKFFKPTNVSASPRADLPDSIFDDTHCLDDMLIEVPYTKLKAIYFVQEGEEEGEDGGGAEAASADQNDDDDGEIDGVDKDDPIEVKKLQGRKNVARERPPDNVKFAVGDIVTYNGMECEVTKVSKDGSKITVEDTDDESEYVTSPAKLTKTSAADPDEDYDDPSDKAPPKTAGRPARAAADDEDEEDEADDDQDDEDDEDDPPPVAKKRGRK